MNHKLLIVNFIIVCSMVFGMVSCTEKIELKTETFEDVLVVEAILTNELKRQEIKLSRTYLLENSFPVSESFADVRIEDSNQNVYIFRDFGSGIYRSDIAFQAVEGVSYKLIINTADNKQYISSEEFMPAPANIDNLYAELINTGGETGVQVFVDSNNNLGDAKFFRYLYEETYKIVAQNYITEDAVLNGNNSNSYTIDIVERPIEQKTCYSSDYSQNIILANTNTISEDKISRFPVRFIKQDNSILRDRYSILVKQYVQSANANNFYKILKDLGGDVSLLLDNQPGFVKGNINSQQSEQEKVIGYFDVSSVSEKRIYFNYLDFGIEKPPYFYPCNFVEYDKNVLAPNNESLALFYSLSPGAGYKLASHTPFTSLYSIVNRECGDCTAFSSSIKPDFWVE
jgi:Domain of unknown function (DUF4249)